MKMNSDKFKTICLVAGLCLGTVSIANGQNRYHDREYDTSQRQYQDQLQVQPTLQSIAQASCCSEAPNCGCDINFVAQPTCGMDDPGCGCEVGSQAPSCGLAGCSLLSRLMPQMNQPSGGCDINLQPSCGCDVGQPSCGLGGGCFSGACSSGACSSGGCSSGACDGGCPLGFGCGSCNLGEPFSLFGQTCGLSAGGWLSIGYHSKNLPLFNSHADRVNVHQAWLYAEKEANGSCGLGLGGRIDYVYGVDAQDTQAFGIDNNHWDNDWDHGIYGNALPQLYMEAAYGNLSVKAGHFFTIIGWEVVTAPDNFFYSHAYTMYNSEPFTHTGVQATLTASDALTLYGGYVLGWDSGFEDNGDAFLGGASLAVSDNLSLTYAATGGRFADSPGAEEKGYMHSVVADVALTQSLQYIFQSDLLDTENNAGETVRDTIGINNYLIYTVNDCLSLGARYEWWNVEADSQGFYGDNAPTGLANVAQGDFDVTALTLGLNYKPHANVIVRPEIRWDWIDGDLDALAQADYDILEDADDNQTTFGIDTIFTF